VRLQQGGDLLAQRAASENLAGAYPLVRPEYKSLVADLNEKVSVKTPEREAWDDFIQFI
jgi:hypothetical protein